MVYSWIPKFVSLVYIKMSEDQLVSIQSSKLKSRYEISFHAETRIMIPHITVFSVIITSKVLILLSTEPSLLNSIENLSYLLEGKIRSVIKGFKISWCGNVTMSLLVETVHKWLTFWAQGTQRGQFLLYVKSRVWSYICFEILIE